MCMRVLRTVWLRGGSQTMRTTALLHASKAQNTSLITLEPRSQSHWPRHQLEKKYVAPVRSGSCRSHPVLERCT